jgi:tRNA(Met) cytidine acetyltransferase
MEWCHAQARNLLNDLAQHRLQLLSNSSNYRQILGKEFDCIIYDCFNGLNADALGAASGTVRGGGALILLTPPLSEWRNFNDPDYRRHGYTDNEQPQGLFIQRLVHLLSHSDAVTRHDQELNNQVNISLEPATATKTTDDQLQTIEAIERVALGHAKRPLVIKADRGRGKSAAIGIAAANLLENGKRNILVTAPAFAAVETLFRHAAEKLSGFSMQRQALTHADGRTLAFIAPDKLVHDKPACDLLCVDEAAAIPAKLLEAMLKQQNRILFSTTVHGYEGSGRGFEIRFRKVLDKLTPQWKTAELKTPIRWREEDALETLLSDLLLFNTDQKTQSETESGTPGDLLISPVTQQELFNDENQLRAFFGLLVSAHYRTRPFDLRHLLDGKQLRLWRATISDRLVGALVCVEEGNIDEPLAKAIRSGKRRPKNQLIPQTLQQHLGVEQALDTRFLRIMRIAVAPDLQRNGIGRQLLATAAADCSQSADLLATSFGATAELLDFWHTIGFTPVRIGLTRDAASGCHSVVMLSPLSSAGIALMQACQRRYLETLPHLLRGGLSDLETDIIQRAFPQTPDILTPDTRSRLDRFGTNALSLDAVLPDLHQLTRLILSRNGDVEINREHLACLVSYSLQELDSKAVAIRLGLTGKSAAEKLLREAIMEGLQRLR